MRLILASRSPRRKKLLKNLGLKFEVIPSRVKERLPKRTSAPIRLAKSFAILKAEDVAKRVKDGLVIAADTIVVLKGEVIGKPKNYEDAKRILQKLSGSRHRVVTGVALIDVKTKRKLAFAESTRVEMKKMAPAQIARFARKHLDKAGAYAVQLERLPARGTPSARRGEEGDRFIKDIEGSFSNVVGLPVEKLKNLLQRFNFSPTAPSIRS